VKREIAKHVELAMREASEGAVLPPATPTPCAWLLLFVPPILVVVAALAWDRLRHIAREFAAVFGRQEEQ
jgi:hypothetical protein